jgi:hypothetical protein
MSQFLIPQRKVVDIFTELSTHPVFLTQKRIYDDMTQTLDFDTLTPLIQALTSSNRVFTPPQDHYNGYLWTQEGDLITITYTSPVDIEIDSIVITNEQITSAFISGTFFG